MAETHLHGDGREIIASREVVVTDEERFKTLFAVDTITTALEAQPLWVMEHETLIGRIALQAGWLPYETRHALRGIDFGRMDISIMGRAPAKQSVYLSCYSRLPGELTRIVTLSECDDEEYLDVSDNHAARASVHNRELQPFVKRDDIAFWMARQALGDELKALEFTAKHGQQALSAAAHRMLSKAEKKFVNVTTGVPIEIKGKPAIVQSYTVREFSAEDSFNYPRNELINAWITEEHDTANKALQDSGIMRRTLVSFSPTNTRPPDSDQLDSESLRVELSTTQDVDRIVLDNEVVKVASKYGPTMARRFDTARRIVQRIPEKS